MILRFSCHHLKFSNPLNKRKKSVENEPIIEPSPFVEIRDSEINVKEIVREIESKIPLPPPTPAEWERIKKMQFQPESPEGYRKFDPANTAFLFEKGISTPKFTNPKLWFIKGPIKFLFTRFIEFYSLVDKKLSENRIKAFFSVLHELIRLSKRIQNLESKLESYYSKYLLRSEINQDFNQIDFGWSTFQYFDQAGQLNFWESAIVDLKKQNDICILFPSWGYLLKELTIAGVKFQAYSNIDSEISFIKSKISSNIEKIKSLFPFSNYLKENSNVVIFIPLNRFPSFLLEKIFAELSLSMKSGNHLYFSIQNETASGVSPFQDIDVTKINVNILPSYLKSQGFESERNLSKINSIQIYRYTKNT